MSDALFHLGLTHRTAPLALRELLRCDPARAAWLLDQLAPLARERLVLSTCERFEIYAFGADHAADRWFQTIAQTLDVADVELRAGAQILRGQDAARWFLRVAAGLESRIVGEPHILGQVRQGFLTATQRGTAGPMLSALGRAAIHTGKRVRHETAINTAGRSIATLTADQIEEDFGVLRDRTVVILGTGTLASDLAVQLSARRAAVMVVGRDARRAAALAGKFRGEGFALDQLSGALLRSDAAVACTSSAEFLIDRAMVERHPRRPLRLWDLSVPRNIDPTIAGMRDVSLTHLEDIVPATVRRSAGADAAARIVEEELSRFIEWRQARAAAPCIADLIRTSYDAATGTRLVAAALLHAGIVRLKTQVAA